MYQSIWGFWRATTACNRGWPDWAGGGRGWVGCGNDRTAGNDRSGWSDSGLGLQLGVTSRKSTVLYAGNRPHIRCARELAPPNRWRIWMRGRVSSCKSTTHRMIERVGERKSTAWRPIRGGSGARSAAHRVCRQFERRSGRPHLTGRGLARRWRMDVQVRGNESCRRARRVTIFREDLASPTSCLYGGFENNDVFEDGE